MVLTGDVKAEDVLRMGRNGKNRRSSESDDEFEMSEKDLRDMARFLDVDERRRGNAKFREMHKMNVDDVCRLMGEADVRRRSQNVGVWRDRYSSRLEVGQTTKQGRLRRRERSYYRDRSSRDRRKRNEKERRDGERYDWKVQKRYRAEWRKENRRLYKESQSDGDVLSERQLEALLEDGLTDSESDEMEYIELVGFSR